MESFTPFGSQENKPPTAATSINDVEPTSSPTIPTPRSQNGSKPRKPPTITPRSFTRFFTPKSSFKRGRRIGASRQVLMDITATASNRQKTKLTSVEKREQIIDQDPIGSIEVTKERKRKIPDLADATPERSSPLKRIRDQSLDLSEDEDHDKEIILDEEEQLTLHNDHSLRRTGRRVDLIMGSSYQSGLGRDLRREIGTYGSITKARSHNQYTQQSKDWRYETTDFFSRPEDAHVCTIAAGSPDHVIPFCTASCNTNSLVAIGDEDGGIRLLESAKDEKPSFDTAYLTFRPHANAILDLAFSPDDLLLATASGDQTSHIIDMPTQRATYILSDHSSSVKQVCFQPGSSDVIATSSRDGSVQVWDLRCKGWDAPVRAIKIPMDASENGLARNLMDGKVVWGRSVNSIFEAHQCNQAVQFPAIGARMPPSIDPPSKSETPGRRGDVSITALQFLPPGREHLLLTASEANAGVKLWDLRTTHNHRRGHATPLSSTRPTGAHMRHRHFGITSLSLSGDGARLYTACRDNTLYTYMTSHLILGHAPELSRNVPKPRRSGGQEKEGLGPIYGFRHPSFHASSFYVKSAVREAKEDRTELIVVGSSDGCAVVFPTNEDYLQPSNDKRMRPADPFGWDRPPMRRTKSGSNINLRLEDSIPIYEHGSALIRGHTREVTGVNWTNNGELVTVSDDCTVRCWREGAQARDLRVGGEKEGRRWACGWAEADSDWDEEDG